MVILDRSESLPRFRRIRCIPIELIAVMTECEKLDFLLKKMGAKICGITLGDTESSNEEIAKAIRKSIISTIVHGAGQDTSSFDELHKHISELSAHVDDAHYEMHDHSRLDD